MMPYNNYKPAKLQWLTRIPENWETKRVAILFDERKILNKNYEIKTAFKFKFGNIVEKKQIGTEEELRETYEKYTMIDKDDIVINGLNLNYDFVTQRVGLVNRKGIITSAYISMTPRESVNPKYACYTFKSMDSMKMLNGFGTGIRLTLSFSELKKQYIPVPPIKEQNQIVKFLDYKISKINKFIKDKKREIELLKELKQAEINRAVTQGLNPNVPMKDSGIDWLGEIPGHWEVRRLRTFCDFANRGTTPIYTEEKITKVVNQATFSKGFWDIKNIRYTEASKDSRRGYLYKRDILLASTGGGVLGKVYLFNEEEEYIADSHVTILRDSKKRYVPEYLYYYLSINYSLINGILAQGSTNQIELQRNWLKSMVFPFPDFMEQEKIASYLIDFEKKTDVKIKYIEIEISKIQEYKASLISEVVTGKVNVQAINIDETFIQETLEGFEAETEEVTNE